MSLLLVDTEDVTLSNNIIVFNVSTLSFTCYADGNPKPSIKWMKKGDLTPISSNEVLSLNPNDKSNEGTYHCLSENLRARDVRHLNIKFLSKPIVTGAYRKNYVVTEGDSLNIKCPVDDVDVEITWWMVS